jgi:2-amino-4-hydroxy-6-hydroxymethyldihydropteridine diphosphokinase
VTPPDARPVTVFFCLGANAGDRLAALQSAVTALSRIGTVVALSPVYETEAHVLPGQPPQPDHLNAVAQVETTAAPEALLAAIRTAERAVGRDPAAPRWSARPLDIDVLLVGDTTLARPDLSVPHPRLAVRRFVLAPLADLAPRLVVPGLGQTVAALLAACPDTARIARTPLRLAAPSGGPTGA